MKARILSLMAIAALAVVASPKTDACSRVVYTGDTTASNPADVLRIVGRSLDWSTPIPTNLYVYPRGMKKQSNASGNMIRWTSKYGAVYAVGYDGGVSDGMNEAGLAVNGLFCRSTIYNTPAEEADPLIPSMSLAMISAWMLDLNATTREVVDMIRSTKFKIVGATFDGGQVSTLHWGITDASGNTAILEYQNGELNIYEGRSAYDILTNDPPYPQMLAINDYWESIGGQNFLPGGVRSPDRFARASFFNKSCRHSNDLGTGLSVVRGIVNDVSVPYGYELGDKNLSQTQWRCFADLRDKCYYFQLVTDLGLYYVDLKECNLQKGAPVLFFDTSKATETIGDISSQMVPHAPFTPMY